MALARPARHSELGTYTCPTTRTRLRELLLTSHGVVLAKVNFTEVTMIKVLSVAVGVFFRLLILAVILAIFHIAKSPFESIVVSILIMLFVFVVGSFDMIDDSLSLLSNHRSTNGDKITRDMISFGFNMLIMLVAVCNLLYVVAKEVF